jgi:hypothetical protein
LFYELAYISWVQNLEILNRGRGHLEAHATSDANPNIKIFDFPKQHDIVLDMMVSLLQQSPMWPYYKLLQDIDLGMKASTSLTPKFLCTILALLLCTRTLGPN